MKEGWQSECEKAIPDELLSTLPIDWQRVTHPRLIFLRSQCFIQAATMSWGNNKNAIVPWCRRGLLAYVYKGVSLTRMSLCSSLVAGKWLLYSTALWP